MAEDTYGERWLLTKREAEVLEALLMGLSAKMIARKLGISPRTVETRKMRVMSKLDAQNSVELGYIAGYAEGRAWIPPAQPRLASPCTAPHHP